MRFKFSWKTSAMCLLLAAIMLRLSYWQWERHQQKIVYIQTLEQRLNEPVAEFSTFLKEPNLDWLSLIHRRVRIKGSFDYAHEMYLQNRRHDEMPGMHLLTPLKIGGDERHIIVDRGFVPLEIVMTEVKKEITRPQEVEFIGLVKPPLVQRSPFAPADQIAGPDRPWVERWLRIDVPNMSKQLSYPVVPVYLEVMNDSAPGAAQSALVDASSNREDIFDLTKGIRIPTGEGLKASDYPIPQYNTIIPPGRHLGYVFEWAAMAFMTLCIGAVLQLKRGT